MKRIIEREKSIIISADVQNWEAFEQLLRSVEGISGIGGIKIGFTMGLLGIVSSVSLVQSVLGEDFPVIYDHQKAANDIPDMGKPFADILKVAGVDAAILFPFAGPATQEAWTEACFNAGLRVIVGGVMTHPRFLVSEGGYIADEAVERIFRLACDLGVRDFVVPGTKLEWVLRIRGWLIEELGDEEFTLYAPGFISQGGDISECGRIAGDRWHAIVGSAIYKQDTSEKMREAAWRVTRQIVE